MAGDPSDHAAEGTHRDVFEDVMGDCASIFIGDMVTAFRALEPAGTEAEQTRRAIIELLGLHVGESEISGQPAIVSPPKSPSPPPAKAEPERTSEAADSTENDEAPPSDSSTAVAQWMPSILETQKIPTPRDAGLLKFPALGSPEPAASELTKGAAPDPLLEPAWSRAI
jgi:hypothetical protein